MTRRLGYFQSKDGGTVLFLDHQDKGKEISEIFPLLEGMNAICKCLGPRSDMCFDISNSSLKSDNKSDSGGVGTCEHFSNLPFSLNIVERIIFGPLLMMDEANSTDKCRIDVQYLQDKRKRCLSHVMLRSQSRHDFSKPGVSSLL